MAKRKTAKMDRTVETDSEIENVPVVRMSEQPGGVCMGLAVELEKKIKSGETHKVDTLLKVDQNFKLQQKVDEIEIKYVAAMRSKTGGEYIDPAMLEQFHDECFRNAMKEYKEHDVYDADESEKYFKLLETHLGIEYVLLQHSNTTWKIKESFPDVRCHLLEHPGKKVVKQKGSDDSNLKLSDIDEDFLVEVDDLCQCLFSRDKLVVRQVNGEACTGKDLMLVAKQFKEDLDSGKMPKVQTILKVGGKFIDPMLEQLHDECFQNAMQEYEKHDVYDVEKSLTRRETLEESLRMKYLVIDQNNTVLKTKEINHIMEKVETVAENIFMEEMEKVAGGRYLEDVNTARVVAKRKAIAAFKTSTSKCNQDFVKECENDLQKAIQLKHEEFERRNAEQKEKLDHDLSTLVAECLVVYTEEMDAEIVKFGKKEDLKVAHKQSVERSMAKFNCSDIGGGLRCKQVKQQSLDDGIVERFEKYEINRELQQSQEEARNLKMQSEKYNLYTKRRAITTEYSEAFQKWEDKYAGSKELCKIHTKAKQEALQAYLRIKSKVSHELMKEYSNNEKALKEEIQNKWKAVKDKNNKNKKLLDRDVDLFYNEAILYYLEIMESENSNTDLDKLHQKINKSLIKEFNRIRWPNIRTEAIEKYKKGVEAKRKTISKKVLIGER
ncbi:uncharacterized protein LOC144749854 [Ciona intestinalis]